MAQTLGIWHFPSSTKPFPVLSKDSLAAGAIAFCYGSVKSLCPCFQTSSSSWKDKVAEELLRYLLTMQGPSKGAFLSVEGSASEDTPKSVFKDLNLRKVQ